MMQWHYLFYHPIIVFLLPGTIYWLLPPFIGKCADQLATQQPVTIEPRRNLPAHDPDGVLQRLSLLARRARLVDVDDLAAEPLDGRGKAGGRPSADLVEN